jgi:hypothetical protein
MDSKIIHRKPNPTKNRTTLDAWRWIIWMRWIIFRAPGNQNLRYPTVALSSECFKQALFSFDFLRFVVGLVVRIGVE